MKWYQFLLLLTSAGTIAYIIYLLYEITIVVLVVVVGKDKMKDTIECTGHYMFFAKAPLHVIILYIAIIAAGAYNLIVNFKWTMLKLLDLCTYVDITIFFLSVLSIICDINYKLDLKRNPWKKPSPDYKMLEDRFIDYFFGNNPYKSIITAIVIIAGIVNAILFGINTSYFK